MTADQLAQVLAYAFQHNSPFNNPSFTGRKTVKYIDPHFDLRDGRCFSVAFRGYGDEAVLHCCNEFRDVQATLFERCMSFLNKSWEPI